MNKDDSTKDEENSSTARNSLLWWLFGGSPEEAEAEAALKTTALSGGAESRAFLRWLFTRSPKLLRRGVQGAAIYGLSYAAKEALDMMHEEYPHNEFIAKADTIARAAVRAEDFLIHGATGFAKSAYDAIPAEAAEVKQPPQPNSRSPITAPPTPEQIEAELKPMDLDKAGIAIPQIDEASLQPMPLATPAHHKPHHAPAPSPHSPSHGEKSVTREAAFMPVIPKQRYRGDLNSKINPSAQESSQPTPVPVTMPKVGCYDPATEITWGPYAKPMAPAGESRKTVSFEVSPR